MPYMEKEIDLIMKMEEVKYYVEKGIPTPLIRNAFEEKILKKNCGFMSKSEIGKTLKEKINLTIDILEPRTCPNEEIEDSMLCNVCMVKKRRILFLPCGHVVCCASCSSSMEKCPLCRQKIESTVIAFLS